MTRASRHLLAAVLCVLPIGSALAKMPKYDLKAYCHHVAASSDRSKSQAILKGCYQVEHESYNALKRIWDKLPAQTRSYCDKVARSGGAGSYIVLQGCVAEEQAAAKPGAKTPPQN